MVLYAKFAHGSQFLGEKNHFKIRYLVAEILKEWGVNKHNPSCPQATPEVNQATISLVV